MVKLNGYMGDQDLRHGGYFWAMDDADSDNADVVRVTPHADMGGHDNVFMIEVGSCYLGSDMARAVECCGMGSDPAKLEPMERVDAMMSYRGHDVRETEWVQIGKDDPYGPADLFVSIDRYLGERTNLRGYVLERHVSFTIDA